MEVCRVVGCQYMSREVAPPAAEGGAEGEAAAAAPLPKGTGMFVRLTLQRCRVIPWADQQRQQQQGPVGGRPYLELPPGRKVAGGGWTWHGLGYSRAGPGTGAVLAGCVCLMRAGA